MRNRSDILNRINFKTDRGNTSDGGLTPGARTLDPDFDFLHAQELRLLGGVPGNNLSGIRRALSGTLKAILATG